MKKFTINPQKIILIVILILFNLAIFASNGVHYAIKIKQKTSIDLLVNYSPVKQNKDFIEVGAYDNYLYAMKAKQELKIISIDSTEIVAFFHHNPISLDDAFAIEDDQNKLDQKLGGPILSETQAKYLLKQVENPNFYYTIQIRKSSMRRKHLPFNLWINKTSSCTIL